MSDQDRLEEIEEKNDERIVYGDQAGIEIANSSCDQPVKENAVMTEHKVELSVIEGDSGMSSANELGTIKKAQFAPLPHSTPSMEQGSMDLLLDVNLDLSVELGRTAIPVREVLQLGPGSIVELDRLAGEPVDILVNGKLIARGEVVVVDENFGIRVTEIASRNERLSGLA